MKSRMKVIRDTKLFEALKKEPSLETIRRAWMRAGDMSPGPEAYYDFSYFAGGLDHIDVKPKGIYFYDIGCNDKDCSFVVRPEL